MKIHSLLAEGLDIGDTQDIGGYVSEVLRRYIYGLEKLSPDDKARAVIKSLHGMAAMSYPPRPALKKFFSLLTEPEQILLVKRSFPVRD